MAANLKVVRVRADFRTAREINEFQDGAIVGRLCQTPIIRRRFTETPYKISSKIRSQLPRRIFSICSSVNPRSINLRVRLRA